MTARQAPTRGRLILVTGGASSGKSAFALTVTGKRGARIFVATGQPRDAEMAERIRRHQEARGAEWAVAEVPVALAAWIRRAGSRYGVIVVDCLTLWLSNLLARHCDQDAIRRRVETLIEAIRSCGSHIVLVTNELGSGVVPMHRETRRFRQLAGEVNQQIARAADDVYWVVSGLPVHIKSPHGSGGSLDDHTT
jgi:adenosylcobinamide kinase/adenosylcobinamide-phosphate guanylyltransferase